MEKGKAAIPKRVAANPIWSLERNPSGVIVKSRIVGSQGSPRPDFW